MSRQPQDTSSVSLPVTEEELQITRQVVDTDRKLRVRKEVHTEPVQFQTQSVLHTVEVERVRVGRVVDEIPAVRQEGEVTIIPVVAEEAVVVKRLVLVEELRLTRKHDTKTAVSETTLRKEQVVVERFDPSSGAWVQEDEA
jgi:stress response protein YsnF